MGAGGGRSNRPAPTNRVNDVESAKFAEGNFFEDYYNPLGRDEDRHYTALSNSGTRNVIWSCDRFERNVMEIIALIALH